MRSEGPDVKRSAVERTVERGGFGSSVEGSVSEADLDRAVWRQVGLGRLSSEFGVSMMDVQMCCRLRLSGASEKLAGTLTNRC